jgi:hypothetical protein
MNKDMKQPSCIEITPTYIVKKASFFEKKKKNPKKQKQKKLTSMNVKSTIRSCENYNM